MLCFSLENNKRCFQTSESLPWWCVFLNQQHSGAKGHRGSRPPGILYHRLLQSTEFNLVIQLHTLMNETVYVYLCSCSWVTLKWSVRWTVMLWWKRSRAGRQKLSIYQLIYFPTLPSWAVGGDLKNEIAGMSYLRMVAGLLDIGWGAWTWWGSRSRAAVRLHWKEPIEVVWASD